MSKQDKEDLIDNIVEDILFIDEKFKTIISYFKEADKLVGLS